MNLIHCNPLLFSVLPLAGLQGVLYLLLRAFSRDRWNIGLLLTPAALTVPLLLKFSGYYIIPEQVYLCAALILWILLKAIQLGRKKLYLSAGGRKLPRMGKMFLLQFIILLPFFLYLTSRPAHRSLPCTLAGLCLAGISLLYEMGRPFFMKGKSWGLFSDVFHTGTALYLWGLFIMVSPQLMGTDWITLIGPILYTLLAIHPWKAFLTGDKLALLRYGEIQNSDGADGHSTLPYSKHFPSEISLPSDLRTDRGNSDHTRIFPMPTLPRLDRTGEDRGFGI